MRIEATLWAGVTVYFVVMSLLYAAVGGDPAGGVLLTVAAAFGGLVAGWTWRWHRRHPPRGADLAEGDAHEEVGSLGPFPTASLRPLGLAVGVAGVVVGVAVGLWMSLSGLAIVASQAALMVRDADS